MKEIRENEKRNNKINIIVYQDNIYKITKDAMSILIYTVNYNTVVVTSIDKHIKLLMRRTVDDINKCIDEVILNIIHNDHDTFINSMDTCIDLNNIESGIGDIDEIIGIQNIILKEYL